MMSVVCGLRTELERVVDASDRFRFSLVRA
jgi:hypothetical protein